MTIFSNRSLSAYILQALGLSGVVFLGLCYALLVQLDWQTWNILVALIVLSLIGSALALSFRDKIMASFERALLHIEAVKMEDYNQYSKSYFESGITAQLHTELGALSQQLQAHKSQYDQHAMLLYQLIDQLDTPMMVFNQRQLLTYANNAFSLLYGEPWQVYRKASPRLLGLDIVDGKWSIDKKEHNWQINQSEFIDAGERHLLLVFTNIDSALRASQLRAWQQIIRVLSHEIRNSLTPVSSLAESLSTKLHEPRDKQALEVVSERCAHLQDFVQRYSSLSQELNLDIQMVELAPFTNKLRALFSEKNVNFSLQVNSIKADPTFMEQVLINLIKNAFEAGADAVNLVISEHHNSTRIEVQDNGHGIANPDNLFVPLYTTKPQGQGIGLTFCRNIVEQHKGQISVKNNPPPKPGACVTITLPAT